MTLMTQIVARAQVKSDHRQENKCCCCVELVGC